jgi:hypothetical protein
MPIKSKGAINPCHNPPKKPYVCPERHCLTASLLAHPDNAIKSKIKIMNRLFLVKMEVFIFSHI